MTGIAVAFVEVVATAAAVVAVYVVVVGSVAFVLSSLFGKKR